MHNFNDVTLLVTVYNRTSSLKRLLEAFKKLNLSFGEIVVTDDGSETVHQDLLKILSKEFDFKLITTDENSGLGANINRGEEAVTKKYVLYIQEDFVPKDKFIEVFKNAYDLMNYELSLDTIRFYAYFPYPYTKSYNDYFDEMIFENSFLKWNHLKFYMYSDHPHLRRATYSKKFGTYLEGTRGDETEFDMALSYIKNKGRGLLVKDITAIFDQKNSENEPSTMSYRSSWKEKNIAVLKIMRFFFYYFVMLRTISSSKIDNSNN